MREELNTEDLQNQLRNYGEWLEHRSDVALSSGERRSVLALDDRPVPTLPRRKVRIPVLSAAAVVVVGVGLLAFSASTGDRTGVTSVATDQGVVVDTEAAVDESAEEESPAVVLDVESNEAEGGDPESGDPESGDPESGDAVANAEPSDGEDAAEPADEIDDDNIETSTEEAPEVEGADDSEQAGADLDRADSETEANTEVEPSDEPGTTDDGTPAPDTTSPAAEPAATTSEPGDPVTAAPPTSIVSAGGLIAFLEPRNGTVVDSNRGSTFLVSTVPGASSYRFTAVQNGVEVFQFDTARTSFLLPGQLASASQGWIYDPGAMTVTVVALNGDAERLASASITVRMQANVAPSFETTTVPNSPSVQDSKIEATESETPWRP